MAGIGSNIITGTLNSLFNITLLVKSILLVDFRARNSDDLLYYLVCKELLGKQEIDIDTMNFTELFLHINDYNLPKYETVGRVRRKVQEKNPELRCNEKIGVNRSINQDEFAEYALEDE